MKKSICIALLICLFTIQTNAQQSKVHINHTAIYVMDIQKTGAFYSNIIGLDTVPEPFHDGNHIWYSTGPHSMLHVIAGATTKKDYYKNQHMQLVAAQNEIKILQAKLNPPSKKSLRQKKREERRNKNNRKAEPKILLPYQVF